MVLGEQATVATENNGHSARCDRSVGELLTSITGRTVILVTHVSKSYLCLLPSLLPHQFLMMEAPVGCIVGASGCDVPLLSLSAVVKFRSFLLIRPPPSTTQDGRYRRHY